MSPGRFNFLSCSTFPPFADSGFSVSKPITSFVVEAEFVGEDVLRFDAELCYDGFNEFLEAVGDNINVVGVFLKELFVALE